MVLFQRQNYSLALAENEQFEKYYKVGCKVEQSDHKTGDKKKKNLKMRSVLTEKSLKYCYLCFQMQNIVPEEDWDSFMKTLRTDLPTTFRITGCKS